MEKNFSETTLSQYLAFCHDQKRLDEKDALIAEQQAGIRQINDALEQSRRELAKKEEELWEMRRAMDVREVQRQEPEYARPVPGLQKTETHATAKAKW